MRTLIVGVAAVVVMAAGVVRAGTATGQIYFHDATVEIAATGSPPACTVRFIPTMTLGGGLAPRLVLIAKGLSQLAFGIEHPERYSDVVIVQHNTRTPLAGAEDARFDQFWASDLAAALKSQSVFFITARRDGKFVSSRYEDVDLGGILTKLEACRSGSRPGDRPDTRPAAPAATAATSDLRRFDGTWNATLTCRRDNVKQGLVGWRYQFTGRFDNGIFHAVHGAISASPATQMSQAQAYDGKVEPDGAMTIWEKTIVGQNDLLGRPHGTVYQSIYTGKLDRSHGFGTRSDLPCELILSKAMK